MEYDPNKCIFHNKDIEVACITCDSYMCPYCVSDHGKQCSNPNFTHILGYASMKTMNILDNLLKKNSTQTEKEKTESVNIQNLLLKLSTHMEKTAAQYSLIIKQIEKLSKRLTETQIIKSGPENSAESNVRGLEMNKKQLQNALKKNDIKSTCKIVQIIDSYEKATSERVDNDLIINTLHDGEKILSKALHAADISICDAKGLSAKYRHLSNVKELNSKWKLDNKYKPKDSYISDNLLRCGNSAQTKYSVFIGDLPISEGYMAYEINPNKLTTEKKEGFGIVEFDKFIEYHTGKITIDNLLKHFIGCFYKNAPMNMSAAKGAGLQTNCKYYVKIDCVTGSLRISGKGISYSADIMMGTTYVPCFIAYSQKSKMTIRPLSNYCEDEDNSLKKETTKLERQKRREAKAKAKKEDKHEESKKSK